jgi:hypothetical protein
LLLPLTAAHCRPGGGWRFSGPNSSTQKITSGSPDGHHLAVGDRIQVLDAGLLRRTVRVGRGLPGLYPLKRDAFLSEQDPEPLVADIVNPPSRPGRPPAWTGSKVVRQPVLSGPGPGDLLDLPPLRQGELRRPAALVLGYSKANPSALKLRITSRTRSTLVKATFAIAAASMP